MQSLRILSCTSSVVRLIENLPLAHSCLLNIALRFHAPHAQMRLKLSRVRERERVREATGGH